MKTNLEYRLCKNGISITQFKSIFIIIFLFMLTILSGCARHGNVYKPKLNEDATLGPVTWGMPKSEALNALGQKIDYIEEDSLIRVENSQFLGQTVTVEYEFGQFSHSPETPLLHRIYVFFPEDFDTKSLTMEISSVLGEIETKGSMWGGNTYDLKEENRYWHSAQSLYDALDEEVRQVAFKVVIDSLSDVKETDEGYAKWWLSNKYLFTAQFIVREQHNGPCLILSGEGYLMPERFKILSGE